MTFKRREFEVANPSDYDRSDYVEVDMDSLGVPEELNKGNCKLSRKHKGSSSEIPCQIDEIYDKGYKRRVLTFRSEKTPPGDGDYNKGSATFILEKGSPKSHQVPDLCVDYYYKSPEASEPSDGYNKKLDLGRGKWGVKVRSHLLRIYFSFVSHRSPNEEIDYTGSATSIELDNTIDREMIGGKWYYSEKLWGQLTGLSFYKDSEPVSLLGKDYEYELVGSNCGPLRATVTLKSAIAVPDPTLRNQGPYNIYRTFYLYSGESFYTEELIVLDDKGNLVAFSPHYRSVLAYDKNYHDDFSRLEDKPQYFSVWKELSDYNRGIGFSSNSAIQEIKLLNRQQKKLGKETLNCDEIKWHLPFSINHKCIHSFMVHYPTDKHFPRLHEIGETWYKRLYKPLRTI